MPQFSRAVVVLGAFLSLQFGVAWARRSVPAKTQYRWSEMTVVRVLPSQVFAKLGLTHTTRYGFTRDGYTKKTPDPTFPVGLTDIVPYDTTHLLLVRGTPQALAQFRSRVLATENEIASSGRWHITVDLLPGRDGTSAGGPVEQDVASDLPFTVSVGDPASRRAYRLRIHVNTDASTVVSCQTGLLPTPPDAARSVMTPAQVWAPASTRPLPPDGVVVFDDRAAARQSALHRLNLSDESNPQDYQVRVVAQAPTSPNAPPAGAPPTPDAPGSLATPSPEETNAPRS